MKMFLLKMAAVVASLATILVLEDLLMGSLPWLGGLLLLAFCGFMSIHLFWASMRKPRRKNKKAAHCAAARAKFVVVEGSHYPPGPRAA